MRLNKMNKDNTLTLLDHITGINAIISVDTLMGVVMLVGILLAIGAPVYGLLKTNERVNKDER